MFVEVPAKILLLAHIQGVDTLHLNYYTYSYMYDIITIFWSSITQTRLAWDDSNEYIIYLFYLQKGNGDNSKNGLEGFHLLK